MGRRLACLVVAAALLLAITAHASDLSTIVPTRVKIQASHDIAAGVGVTPTFAGYKSRHLREELTPMRSSAQLLSRRLQDVPTGCQYYGPPNGPPLNLPPGFMQDIYNVVCTFNVTASGRRRLAEGPELVFYATLKKGILVGSSDGVYVFNQDSYDFLTSVSKSGSDYKFLRGVLILPDEYTTTNAPPFAVSTTGFVSPDPSKPVLVKLNTQGPANGIPNVAVRFDYMSTVSGYTPLFSVYLSSLAAAYPQGLPQADLSIATLPASFGTVVDDISERLGAGK